MGGAENHVALNHQIWISFNLVEREVAASEEWPRIPLNLSQSLISYYIKRLPAEIQLKGYTNDYHNEGG